MGFLKFMHLAAFSLLLFTLSSCSSNEKPLCHDNERSALLQFMEGLIILDPDIYSCELGFDITTWKSGEENIECCLWDGVECNENTGHVVELVLNQVCLNGSLNSINSLVHLIHLERLDLGYNFFYGSSIPHTLANMSSLTYLCLSRCGSQGEFPSSIANVTKLVHLDLSDNSLSGELPTVMGDFGSLEEVYLYSNKFSGQLPTSIGNLRSLKYPERYILSTDLLQHIKYN